MLARSTGIAVANIARTSAVPMVPVSYTHLTLPTKA